jgi:hypothetical protein
MGLRQVLWQHKLARNLKSYYLMQSTEKIMFFLFLMFLIDFYKVTFSFLLCLYAYDLSLSPYLFLTNPL